jgi:hypothetical protein
LQIFSDKNNTDIITTDKIKVTWWSIYFARLAKYSVVLTIIPALYFAFFPGKIVLITILCSYPLIFALVHFTLKNGFRNLDGLEFIKLFLVYNIIVFVRGIVDVQSSQDYKVLLQSGLVTSLFLPLVIQFSAYKNTIIIVFKSFLSYGLMLCSIMYFMPVNSGPLGFNAYISPITIILLFSPYLTKKYRPIIYLLVLISFFHDFSNRANLLNILVSVLMLFTYLISKKKMTILLLKVISILLLISPIVFFGLGITGIFNVFTIGKLLPEYSLAVKKKNVTQELFVDSRTSIYLDVFKQLKHDKMIFIGLGGSGKTKTALTEVIDADYDKIYKEGRRGTESGMLNMIQTGGLIGGLIYYFLFFTASYYGVFKSKNWFCVLLGVWLSYKCFFSFIEDPLSFSISSLFLFFSIGVCLNKNFRQLSDTELKELFNFKIFSLK